ncbi:tyrosine-type recombinase/integrase [Streptomyces albireticuli]|uniref:Site-specific integrase n=1 Tax=Streptomyces albireticuli TaxID=1940 RepID=A0A2A2D7N1_9ACTN|nr:site-specific integrase [Streptomyces albireticuli]MCD9144350.1 site-specific integrase [Streptomyces albireticuli]MCD9162007.1 site-specific integrase [Streptomyces albireticuli]MCD9193987.1 site-specific integrase [Streptomyces albireticuli]PAU47525.1 site-specific integrase [Streptomyces albireticuli]
MTRQQRHQEGARSSGRPAGSEEVALSADVRVWKISKVKSKKAPYQLRWTVAGKVKSCSFTTVALAESRRSELWQAMRRGEGFDVDTGLPESELRAAVAKANAKPDPNWWEFSREYMGVRWRSTAAKTREGLADSLATVAIAMAGEGAKAPEPEEVRLAVRWAVVPAHRGEEPPPELYPACSWLSTRSLSLSALTEPRVLRDVHYRLAFKLDDAPAAAETYKRRRRGFNTAMEYAVQEGYLAENPLAGVKRPGVSAGGGVVDPRVLVNETQGRQLLTAVSYVGSVHRNRGRRLVAFFGCMLYAAMRPAEVVGLEKARCYLPETGWGVLTLQETRPVAGKKWTDSGERHDKRGLKSREAAQDRPVPIPPVLVALLRGHIAEFGTAKGGRLFGNERGGLLGSSSYWRVWQEARELALPPDKVASPLARRPYDLRSTCITNWLRAGLPVAEVARRAGNSPEVIHRNYAGCLDDTEEDNNRKIEEAMGWGGPSASGQ